MHVRISFLVFWAASCLSFSSCGGNPPAQSTPAYDAVEGNWHLTGKNWLSVLQGPYIGLAIGVRGNTIYASGEASATCADGTSGVGSSISATGQIASDGTFLLRSPSTLSTVQFTIQGRVPAAGASSWQGSYTVFNSTSSLGCTFSHSGDFTATPYPPFNGTYAGTLHGAGLSSGINVVLRVSQGTPTVILLGQIIPEFYLPLAGDLTATGSPCLASSNLGNGVTSFIAGDHFFTMFTLEDGSTVQLQGWFSDQTENTLQTVFMDFLKGQCAGTSISGTLTLQP